MKKVNKLLFTILVCFVFLPFVYGEDKADCSEEAIKGILKEKGVNIDSVSKNDIMSLVENCKYQNDITTDKDYNGCTRINASAQDAYKESGKIGGIMNSIEWTQVVSDKNITYGEDYAIETVARINVAVEEELKLTKSYYVVGIKDNKIKGIYFAGCYKGYLKYLNDGEYKIVQTNDNSVSSKPVYYIKVLEPSDDTCKLKATGGGDVFIPSGIELKYLAQDPKTLRMFQRTLTTKGEPRVGGYGFQKYEFNGCPDYFNLGTSFVTWWPYSRENAFIFSDSPDISYNPSWIRKIFTAEENAAAQATTEVDVEEKERVTQCYENVAKKASGYSCDDIEKLAEKLQSEQSTCNNENSNFFRDVDESIQTEMLQKTVTAINGNGSKIVNCHFKSCNVGNQSLTNKITEDKYSKCLKTCVSELKISNTLQSNTYSNSCSSCYKTFYNDLSSSNSITSEQKTCLDKQADNYNEQINKLQSNFEDIVDNNMEKALEGKTQAATSSIKSYTKYTIPDLGEGGGFGTGKGNCASVLGTNGTKIVKGFINILRIVGAIIVIVNAMLALIPAVVSKDADGLKKASSKCVKMAIILAVIGAFPYVVRIIGKIFRFDLSCI